MDISLIPLQVTWSVYLISGRRVLADAQYLVIREQKTLTSVRTHRYEGWQVDFVLFIRKTDLFGMEMLWSDRVEWRAESHKEHPDECARGAQVFQDKEEAASGYGAR